MEESQSEFPITIGLHQRSAISPYIFALVMDKFTKLIVRVLFWTMSRPKLKQGPRAFKLLFKGTGLGSPQLNGLFTNQVVHRARILQYVYTSKQEYICIEQ